MEANIKLKGGKELKARFCKIELCDGGTILVNKVEYLPKEDIYWVVPVKRTSLGLANEHLKVSRNQIKKMSIVK